VNAYPRFPTLINLIICVMLVLSLSACASAPEGQAISTTPPEIEEDYEYHVPRLLGFVIDPDGNPVPFAEVGGEDIATEDGVTSGDFLDYEGGWIPVTALGYASGYARAFAADQDFPFFVTYLTPYQSMVLIEDENPFTMRGFYQEDIFLSAEISLDLFKHSSVMAGLAVMDRYSVSPVLAPYPDGEGLWLRNAFALEAYDGDGNRAELNSGAMIPVTLEMSSPLSDQAAFARFDMASGEWRTLDLACEGGEGNLYTCQLDTLDPLIGIFDQPDTFIAGVAHSPREGAAVLSSGNATKEDFLQALKALVDWINSQQDNPDGIDHTNPILIKLIADLKKVAMDFAKDNQNEAGKRTLLQAAGQSFMTGQYDVGTELRAEAIKIADEVGKHTLKESDCGEYLRLLKAAGQIQLTGGDMNTAQELIDKAHAMAVDCDVWTGSITVWLYVSSTHRSGLPQTAGTGSWIERHNVKLSTNVETYEMFGEDWVTLNFGEVTYSKDSHCLKEVCMYGSGGDNLITVEGMYDGYTFTVTLVSPQGEGGSISQSWISMIKQDGECILDNEYFFSFSPFHSFLTHGVADGAPLVSFVEILDTTNLRVGPEFDRIRGEESISGLDPEMGIYPAENGIVFWNLFHAAKKLPLKAE